MSDEEVEGIIDAVDKNGDGHISYDGNLIELFLNAKEKLLKSLFCISVCILSCNLEMFPIDKGQLYSGSCDLT